LGLLLELAPSTLRVSAPRDLTYKRVIYELRVLWCNTWGAKCNMVHDHEHLTHINPYKLFLLNYLYLFYLFTS
jgi:hypothetical protein